MELRQLYMFQELARQLNFTRAAEALNYTQSNVTAQIQALEAELGVQLFDRLGKKVVLTPAGEQFRTYTIQALKLLEEARSAVAPAQQPAGSLVVGASETAVAYRLPPVLQAFRARYPNVQLSFHPSSCSDLRQLLHDGTIQLAFLMERPVKEGNLVVEELLTESMALVAPPDHPLVPAESVEARDIAGETILLTEKGCSYRVMLEDLLAAHGVQPGSTLEFGNLQAIKQSVMVGVGIALLPRIVVAAELEQGRLAELAWSGSPLDSGIQIAWHKDKWLSPALQAFINVTRQILGGDRVASGGN